MSSCGSKKQGGSKKMITPKSVIKMGKPSKKSY